MSEGAGRMEANLFVECWFVFWVVVDNLGDLAHKIDIIKTRSLSKQGQ